MNVPDHPRKGQRPIVVYDGLIGKKVALQFIQSGERIVGEFFDVHFIESILLKTHWFRCKYCHWK